MKAAKTSLASVRAGQTSAFARTNPTEKQANESIKSFSVTAMNPLTIALMTEATMARSQMDCIGFIRDLLHKVRHAKA